MCKICTKKIEVPNRKQLYKQSSDVISPQTFFTNKNDIFQPTCGPPSLLLLSVHSLFSLTSLCMQKCLPGTNDAPNCLSKDGLKKEKEKGKARERKEAERSLHHNFLWVYLFFLKSIRLSGGFTGSTITLCILLLEPQNRCPDQSEHVHESKSIRHKTNGHQPSMFWPEATLRSAACVQQLF